LNCLQKKIVRGKKVVRFFYVLIALMWASVATAETHEVLMLNKDKQGNRMVFSTEILHVKSGDTVNWIAKSKGHNVEIITSPNNMKFKSKLGKDATLTFTDPGVYYYWCTPHKGVGMIGLVIVDNDLSNLQDITKVKSYGKSKKKLKAFLKELGG